MNELKVGVGPHLQPWPTDEKFDVNLLENGDTRNVIDKYRYWTLAAIRADMHNHQSSLHIAIENWQHDFNIGTIVRAANAFNIEQVHIVGKKRWNRRGAMVTDKYLTVVHHATVQDFEKAMRDQNRQIIAVDIIPGAVPISKTDLPPIAVMVFGSEGPGISSDMQQIADKIVMIEQFGSTRSVNVGVAAGIAMYMWTFRNILD